MEVSQKKKFQLPNIREFFLGDKKPFVDKRDVNWSKIRRIAILLLVAALGWILVMPSPKEVASTFHEKVDTIKSPSEQKNEMTPTDQALNQMAQGSVNTRSVPCSLDYLYADGGGNRGGGGGTSGGSGNPSSMILTRAGMDSHTQLPPGTRVRVRLLSSITVNQQAIPLIGLVSSDVPHENGVAIESGAKLYGDVTFDESSERGAVVFRSIRLPDGRERQISGIALSLDGQAGVEGKVHSERLKTAIGQTITRFVGAYAEGSMERGALGGQPGGASNGLKNAIAETAKDRAEDFGKSLSEERKWLELPGGSEFLLVLNQPFTFREPGAMGGN